DLARGREQLLLPAVIKGRVQALAAAQLRHLDPGLHPGQHDPQLFRRRPPPPFAIRAHGQSSRFATSIPPWRRPPPNLADVPLPLKHYTGSVPAAGGGHQAWATDSVPQRPRPEALALQTAERVTDT